MPAGRPSKYNAKILDLAREYVDNHKEHGDHVPTAAGLACELKVSKSTVYKWASENPEFSDTLGELNSKQERLLANGGISGDFNATITKLMLANHGYSEKTENVNTLQGPGGESLEVSFIGVCNNDNSK